MQTPFSGHHNRRPDTSSRSLCRYFYWALRRPSPRTQLDRIDPGAALPTWFSHGCSGRRLDFQRRRIAGRVRRLSALLPRTRGP